MKVPKYLTEPKIQDLSQLLDEIHNGELFIPKFQSHLVWTDEQRLDLLRSISDAIPISSLLVWRTNQHGFEIFDDIAGLPISAFPESTSGVPRTYVLDGCQRLLTLFGALKRSTEQSLSQKTNIVNGTDWRFFYDLKNEDFVLQGRKKMKPSWMPVNVLLDSLALLRFQRQLEKLEQFQFETEDWIIRTDQLSNAFRYHKIVVMSIITDDSEPATTAFKRIKNRNHYTDMIAALAAWRNNNPRPSKED